MKPSEMVVGKWYHVRTYPNTWSMPHLRHRDDPMIQYVDDDWRECCPHGRGMDETCGECKEVREPSHGKCEHGYDPNCLACHAEKLAMLKLCSEHNITTAEQLRERLAHRRYEHGEKGMELLLQAVEQERDELRERLCNKCGCGTCGTETELREKLAVAEAVIGEWRRAWLLPDSSTPEVVADHIREVAASCSGLDEDLHFMRLRAERAEAECERLRNVTPAYMIPDTMVEREQDKKELQPSAVAQAPPIQRGAIVRVQGDWEE